MNQRPVKYPVILHGTAFCLGILIAATIPQLPSIEVIVAGLLLTGLCLLFTAIRSIGLFGLGCGWFLFHAAVLMEQSWPDARAGEQLEIRGQVVSLPEFRGQRVRFELKTDAESQTSGVPDRVLLTWYRPRAWFQPGERWQLQVRLDPPHGRLNPGGFDYHRYLMSRGIGATGTIMSADRLQPADWRAAPQKFRQRFADWAQANTDDLDAAALIRALTVGDRSAMDHALSDDLRRTGTAHLLAISGLHVGMVATLAGFLTGWLLTPLLSFLRISSRRQVVLLAGLVAALIYAMLAGFSLPTQRALIMLTVGFGALLWRRTIQPGYALLAALIAVLLIDPLAPLATGFWLSFSAVAVLIWAFAWRSERQGWLLSLVRAQVVIMIGLLALNIGVFQQLIPVALIANMIAIPMVGFWILPWLLIALAMYAFALPSAWALYAAEQGLVVLVMILDRLAGVEGAYLARPVPELWAIVLAFIGGIWLIAPARWPARGLGVCLFLPLLFPRIDTLRDGEFDFWLLDVGNGLAAVIQTQGETVLYDTGGGDGESASLYPGTIAPLLRAVGSSAIHRIVVSNHQRAHAGGLFAVLAANPGASVFRADPGVGQSCLAGEGWKTNDVSFTFLHPSPGLPYLGPDSSCVLEVRSEHGSVLLTGRIGEVVARRLDRNRVASVDAVVLPRAGHRDSFDAEWLSSLDPDWVLISVSAINRRGLPHQDVAKNIRDQTGRNPISTGRCGAVRLSFRTDQEPQIMAWVFERKRFWHARRPCTLDATN